jgi:hypothetical protein
MVRAIERLSERLAVRKPITFITLEEFPTEFDKVINPYVRRTVSILSGTIQEKSADAQFAGFRNDSQVTPMPGVREFEQGNVSTANGTLPASIEVDVFTGRVTKILDSELGTSTFPLRDSTKDSSSRSPSWEHERIYAYPSACPSNPDISKVYFHPKTGSLRVVEFRKLREVSFSGIVGLRRDNNKLYVETTAIPGQKPRYYNSEYLDLITGECHRIDPALAQEGLKLFQATEASLPPARVQPRLSDEQIEQLLKTIGKHAKPVDATYDLGLLPGKYRRGGESGNDLYNAEGALVLNATVYPVGAVVRKNTDTNIRRVIAMPGQVTNAFRWLTQLNEPADSASAVPTLKAKAVTPRR